MKKLTFVLLLFSVFYVTILSDVVTLKQKKIILTSQNLSPLGFYDEKGNYDGIAVKVVKYALEKMNVKYEINIYPWARAQMLVKTGEADGFFAGSKNAEREEYAVMSSIIAEQNWVWYQLKNNPLNPKDLSFKKNAKVGAYIGANMLDWLNEKKYNVTAKPRDTESLFKMLMAKRVDAILANHLVANEIIKNEGIAEELKSTVEKEHPLGVYFSKKFLEKNPGFIESFNYYIKEYFEKHKSQ
jgi:polar amino acid transport system substrate-binding protein